MKKTLSIILRLLVAAAGVAYIVWTLTWTDRVALPAGYLSPGSPAVTLDVAAEDDAALTLRGPDSQRVVLPRHKLGHAADQPRFRPSIFTTLRGADVALLVTGLLLIGLVWPLQSARWWVLMRCRGLEVSAFKAFRLFMVGLFFNFCMPGMTGGDVVKAYYAAKGSGARGAAVMSVVFDRITGLFALMLLAGAAGLFMLDDAVGRSITAIIWVSFALLALFFGAYFSRRLRRGMGVDGWLSRRSPQSVLVRLDAAAAAYRNHPGAVLLAVLIGLPTHVCNVTAVALAGFALGMDVPLLLLLTVLPLVFLAGSLPISYQGLGVMEGLAIALLLDPPAATANQIVGMLLIYRLYLIVYAMLGSLVLLRGDIHLHPQEAEDDAPEPVAVA